MSDDFRSLIRAHLIAHYPGMLREAGGALPYPFLTPGSQQYDDVLWDWDSWLSNVALRQILHEAGDPAALEAARPYERGCILNALHFGGMNGYVPIVLDRSGDPYRPADIYRGNMRKPCLAQHAAFLVRADGGDAEWLRDRFYYLLTFLGKYKHHHRHDETGLVVWETDSMIGVDDDPSTYYRPPRSSASIYLNCLMLAELDAAAYLADRLNLDEVAAGLRRDRADLHAAIQEHCWDERDGFFYSVDVNLRPAHTTGLHAGAPRAWSSLIQRIGVWSGFLALWSGAATPEQAARVVEHARDSRTFNAAYGIRTLSRLEKMYTVRASGNPSCWLGPVWGVSNYLTFRGLVRYGFTDDARALAEKTVALFGRDIQRFDAMHEYYQPDNGEPVLNRGFQNWNALVLNMIAWLDGAHTITEFTTEAS